MKLNPLIIGDLIAKKPVIQGGMGIGVSLSNLAGTVAKFGGIGVISAAHAGYLESDFETNTLAANLRGLKKHIKKAKEISSNGIIGVNIMVATTNYKEYVKAAIEAGADLIISGAGLPLNLPELIENSKVKIAPIVSSLKGTKLILKYWNKHYNKIPDAVVIEGPMAGGHLGFKADDIIDENIDFKSIVSEIINEVNLVADSNQCKIPVIVGGGIFSSEDVKEYLSLGANGVQVATRFVATDECDAHINFKNTYVNCNKEDITIVKSPVGMPGRAIRNKFLTSLNGSQKINKCYNCLIPCNPLDTHYCISDALIKSVKGDINNGLLFCGANAYKIDKLLSVEDVILDLFKDIN